MRTALIVVLIVATIALIAWFLVARRHPERAATHRTSRPDTRSERFYGEHPPGPAGPDAEAQNPDDTGNARHGGNAPRSTWS